jgi:CRISPR system Cascade subunit CasA
VTSFHLDTQPWLPVTYADGTPAQVSLRTLLADAHKITTINFGSPPAAASLLRILSALTYRVTGLDSVTLSADDWHDQRKNILARGQFDAAAITAYFDAWHHRFDLFDVDRPWRQEPRLRDQCSAPAGINTLIVERPAGNNPTVFSAFHDNAPGAASIAEAVEALLVRQFYGPQGRCQSRALPGQKSTANFTYVGPLRARISYHPVGATLFETLLAHLVPPLAWPFTDPTKPDLAEWETPDLPNPDGTKPHSAGIVGLLANDSGHGVLLIPGHDETGVTVVIDGYLTWRFTDKTAGNLIGGDPYLSYRYDTKGTPIPRTADTGRDMWRDLPALLADPHGTHRNPENWQQPLIATAIAELPVDVLTRLRMAAYGFVQHAFQPNNHDWNSALSPAVFEAAATNPHDPTAHEYLTAIPAWVATAEAEARVLSQALFRALRDGRGLDPKGEPVKAWSQAATPAYWQQAFTAFDDALAAPDGAAFAATVLDAPARLRQITIALYDRTTGAVRDSRGLLAVTKHRPRPLPSPSNALTQQPAEQERAQ